MKFPPRLAHLATRAVVVAKLMPTYAEAHSIEEEEASQRLDVSLKSPLLEELLGAAWASLKGSVKRLDDDGLLEKVARSLADRPLRPGKVAALTPAWSAFLVLADLHAGTASDSARKVMESDAGRKMARAGLESAGAHLAAELTR